MSVTDLLQALAVGFLATTVLNFLWALISVGKSVYRNAKGEGVDEQHSTPVIDNTVNVQLVAVGDPGPDRVILMYEMATNMFVGQGNSPVAVATVLMGKYPGKMVMVHSGDDITCIDFTSMNK